MSLLWLPDATHDTHSGQRVNPWSVTTHPKGVLHTTEGSGWPSYSGWTIDPHATVMPEPGKGVTVRQHIPFSSGSFALENHAGGVETNRAFAFQFELIGTCDPHGPGYHWPNADDAVLLDLWHKVIKPLSVAYSIPVRAPEFKAYPSSYGTGNGVRFGFDTWMKYSGWCGHQHVPENVHGDPGGFPFARLAALAARDTGGHPPKPPTPRPATHPAFPLPAGYYFGPKTGGVHSVSGYYSHRADLHEWQAQMVKRGWGITPDGYYGDQTAKVARGFQKQLGYPQDALIGPKTWGAAWTARITSRAPAPPPAPPNPTAPPTVAAYVYAEGDDKLLVPAAVRGTRAVAVTDKTLAQYLMTHGARVVVIGGPAVTGLGLTWAAQDATTTNGAVTALNGATFERTGALALRALKP